MQQYERDTWYDIHGRIVFTNSKGPVGVGLPRKGGTARPEARLTLSDGTVREGQLAGKTCRACPMTRWCSNGYRTIPCPPARTAKNGAWVAPFARARREDDYRIAWVFFEAQAAVQTTSNSPRDKPCCPPRGARHSIPYKKSPLRSQVIGGGNSGLHDAPNLT